ncbi:MAG: lipid-binding SYLF domain-containing protein [Rhodospirillales bacterium]|nr:lipid-binding SYLF domain-containing protein [Rhodospirillales bacterium]MBO6788441.1 lipid-binding SYLF domain-containing protein [Rhodospirillales bacterium]
MLAGFSRRRFLSASAGMLALGSLAGCTDFEESPVLKAEHLVDSAVATVERFQTIQGLQRFSKYLPDSVAIAIFPNVIKAGFFVGGEGGNGLLMAKKPGGGWSAPAFYTLGAGSFGLQFGAQSTEVILVIRNQGALDAILKDQAKIGADAGVTAGFYGLGAEASTTTNLGADVLAFANSKVGAFAGASVEGAVMARRQDINEAIYGTGKTPKAIVTDSANRMARADRLAAVLSKY